MNQRQLIVDEALTWIGTPWHHEACVKGHGVDCANFLAGVYVNVGLIEPFVIERYPPDWHLHSDDPRFLKVVETYCRKVDAPKMGDIVMFKIARAAAHGAILIDPARMVIAHAWKEEGKVTLTDLPGSPWEPRVCGYYRWTGFL